jgi:ABC-type polysaccharide/polyol phosphate export permease
MTQESKQFAWHFIQLMFAVFLLFFLTVGLGKATADLVVYMNDAKVSKPVSEWVVFWVSAPLATAFWCLLWIWFKKSEKQCIELFGK